MAIFFSKMESVELYLRGRGYFLRRWFRDGQRSYGAYLRRGTIVIRQREIDKQDKSEHSECMIFNTSVKFFSQVLSSTFRNIFGWVYATANINALFKTNGYLFGYWMQLYTLYFFLIFYNQIFAYLWEKNHNFVSFSHILIWYLESNTTVNKRFRVDTIINIIDFVQRDVMS